MITIAFSKKSEGLHNVEERLKDLSLGYQLKQKKKYKKIELQTGEKRYKGFVAIHKYLDEIQGELSSWWYCDC